MHHPTEHELALFVLHAPEAEASRSAIEAHLTRCVGCEASVRYLREHFVEVGGLLRHDADREALTVRSQGAISRKIAEGFVGRRWWPEVIRTVRRHAMGISSAAVVLLALVGYLVPRLTLDEREIAYARAKDAFLEAYDREGAELWRRFMGIDFGTGSALPTENLPLWVGDVDHDQHNEVIVNTGFSAARIESGEPNLTCFARDGSVRWSFRETSLVQFARQTFRPTFKTGRVLVRDLDRDGTAEVILLACHVPYSPAVAVLLNGATGDVRGRYWHWGYLDALAAIDADGDGVDEVYVGGQNNAYGLASLAVLEPNEFNGHAPMPDSLRPPLRQATHQAYVLFPRSPLASFATELRNSVEMIVPAENGGAIVEVAEFLSPRQASVHFILDSTFSVDRVVATDYYLSIAGQLAKDGRLRRQRMEHVSASLARQVKYWNGVEFRSFGEIVAKME